MATLTRWVLAHRRLVVASWLLITLIGLADTGRASDALSKQFAVPGREGYETNQAIARRYGTGGAAAPIVAVLTLPGPATIDGPGVRAELAGALGRVAAALPGARIASYATLRDPLFVSADRRTTFALVYPPSAGGDAEESPAPRIVARALGGVAVGGASFRVTGMAALRKGGGGGGLGVLAEALLGGLGALLVLAFVFGSFLAVVPIAMAIVAIPATFLLVWALTAVTDVSFIVEFLIALIGLGIAIDYSLLIVLRWREERERGAENAAAVERAMATAGTAVLFSGTTVAIGLLALVVLPVPFLRSVGYGGMLIPLVSVAVATTLLPVALASIGPRLDWPRRARRPGRFWPAWGALVVRRRGAAAAASLLVLAALTLLVAGMRIGDARADALATAGEAYQGLHALEASGIGAGPLTPFEVLVRRTDVAAVARQLAGTRGVRGAVAPPGGSWRRGGTALLAVLPVDDGSSPAGRATLDRIRRAARGAPGQVRIGGAAAANADFIDAVYGNFPTMVALIALVTFVLLARAFRSLLLPLKAVALVVLSAGAAWGLMVLVWQEGHGSLQIWGVPATGSLDSYVPLMVFAFLFGISMDYEVFILARMREEYDACGSTDRAVVAGIAGTGRLVTSAGLILFLAFASLASGPQVTLKVFATGLAAGVLLDATVIRMLLVPAVVSLLGRWNWWLPALPARLLGVRPSPSRAP